MKRMIVVLLLLVGMLALVLYPAALAAAPGEGVPAPVIEDPTSPGQLLDKQMLLQMGMGGLVVVTMLFAQGIKLLFMRACQLEAIRRMVYIVAFVVTIAAKVMVAPRFELADLLILPANGMIVALAGMKAYEKYLGVPQTPAGDGVPNGTGR